MVRPASSLFLALLVGALLAPGLAQAGSKIALRFEAAPPAELSGPAVGVSFENVRPAKQGGNELPLIGQVRSTIGIPYGLFSHPRKGGHADRVVPEWVAATLRASGVRAKAGMAEGGARVHVILEELWGDGHTRYTMGVRAKLQLFPAGATEPALEHRVDGEGGATVVMSVSTLERGYVRAFEAAGAKIQAWTSTDAFKAALGGSAPAAAPAEVAPEGASETGASDAAAPAATEGATEEAAPPPAEKPAN